MSGMPLETCWAFNERWNNKFYYKVASWWLFLLTAPLPLSLPVIIHSVLNSTTNEREWSRQGRFTHERRDPDTCWIECWVGHWAGLNILEEKKISCLCQESNHISSDFPFVAGPLCRPVYADQCNIVHAFYPRLVICFFSYLLHIYYMITEESIWHWW
jgi:hypothetical protein